MKCPHCLIDFHDNEEYLIRTYSGSLRYLKDASGLSQIYKTVCSKCGNHILFLTKHNSDGEEIDRRMVYPKATSRPVPKEVDAIFAEDFTEACLVLSDSPKASAALSRRCLQNLLREKGGFEAENLSKEIQKAIDSKSLPSYITENLDAVRNIGNFAAHPTKSTSSGEIVAVEPNEAEWNLDILEALFDFYFVQPAKMKEKQDALNKKLQDAGKPEMK